MSYCEFDDRGTGFVEDSAGASPPLMDDAPEDLFNTPMGGGEAEIECSEDILSLLDQQRSQGCTAFSLVQGARTLMHMDGISDPELLSALDIYYNSRPIKKNDNGASINEMFLQTLANGYCKESAWPFDMSKVLVAPPPSVRSSTYDQVGKIQYYRTEDWGTGKRQTQIERALQNRWLIIGGFPVDSTFRQYQGGVWDYPGAADGSDAAGWHAALGIGYTSEGMRIVNSWGPNWGGVDKFGRRGFATIGWNTIRNPYLYRGGYVLRRIVPTTGVSR